MHRHGYKGKKFGRQRDQRQALIKGLADSLVLNESIETTLAKAKVAVSYTEKLITKAKKGGLHNRRQIMSSLNTVKAAHKLVDELAPKLSSRSSGYLRIEKGGLRRGDGVQLAKVSFVDDLKAKTPVKKTAGTSPKAATTKKPAAKKTTTKDTK